MNNVRSIEHFEADEGHDPINSPRSLEACLRLGYNPAELLPRSKAAFRRPTFTEEMVEIAAANAEKKRLEKIRLIKQERSEIIRQIKLEPLQTKLLATGGAASMRATGGGEDEDGVADEIGEQAAEFRSKMIEDDYKRFEAAKKRQRRELERLIEGEQKMQELHEKIKATEKYAEEKAKLHAVERKKRQEAQAEKSRKREEEKMRRDQEELYRRKELADAEAAREAEIVAKEVRDLKHHRRMARERDIARRVKIEEHQQKMEELIREQEAVAKKSRDDLQRREQILMDALTKRQEKLKQERQANQEKAAKRLQSAAVRQKEAQEKKLRDYEERQREAAERAEEKRKEEEEMIKKVVKAKAEKDAHRLRRLEDAKRIVQDRKLKVAENRRAKLERMEGERSVRLHALSLKNLHGDLRHQEKLENVERIRRVEEFERIKLMQKIQADDDRSERIAAERRYLKEQRLQSAHDAFLRKVQVKNAMEQMRISNKATGLEHFLDGGKKKKSNRGDADGEDGAGGGARSP